MKKEKNLLMKAHFYGEKKKSKTSKMIKQREVSPNFLFTVN
jgi:hypothetical protein